MALTEQQNSSLLAFTSIMFDFAPDAASYARFESILSENPSFYQLGANLGATEQFLNQFDGEPTAESVMALLAERLGIDTEADIYTTGVNYIAGQMEAGVAVGQIMVQIGEILLSETVPAGLEDAAAIMQNKIAVSQAYLDSGLEGYSNVTLPGLLSGVTADAASVEAAQASIDEAVDAAAPFTLTKGLEDLAAANQAKADFLAEVDGDDDADTSWTEGQVATALTTAQNAVAAEVDKSADYAAADYTNASTGVKAAILADYQAELADALAAEQEDVADAQADVDAVAGLTAAQDSVEAAADALEAAQTAAGKADNALTAALADFDDSNDPNSDDVDATAAFDDADLTDDVVVYDATTVIEYDADAEAFVLAADIAEEDYEGVTAVVDAMNAKVAADAAVVAAQEALLNAQLERNYLDLSADAEDDLADIAAAFQVTELAEDEMPTLAEIQTEISILEGLRDALDTAIGEITFDTDDATTLAALQTLLDNAEEDGAISAADNTAIYNAFDTAGDGTLNDQTETDAAIAAAQAALATNNNLDRAVTGLQALVDIFVDFDDSANGTSATNPLASVLETEQGQLDAVEADIEALEDALSDLADAQADVDTLEGLNDAIDAAEAAFEDNGFAVPTTIDADNEYATSGDDVFVLGTIADNTANVLNFGLLGDDKIFIGTDYVLNEGALATDGDNSVLEVFLTEVGGNATITVEQEVFGSNSADAETVITLTGVPLEEITFADGFISLV